MAWSTFSTPTVQLLLLPTIFKLIVLQDILWPRYYRPVGTCLPASPYVLHTPHICSPTYVWAHVHIGRKSIACFSRLRSRSIDTSQLTVPKSPWSSGKTGHSDLSSWCAPAPDSSIRDNGHARAKTNAASNCLEQVLSRVILTYHGPAPDPGGGP